jgi:alkylation response protein AidB-like acyl-CoA dehydrogenase
MRAERSSSQPTEFARIRAELSLHPAESSAAGTFEAAARAARTIAEECLPLGLAVVMHLYPLCAMRCVPIPWWSTANLRRLKLLRLIDSRSLILANAGSERSAGTHSPVTISRTSEGVLVNGAFEYMSLAHAADIVLFSAPLTGSPNTMFCAADLHGSTVRIGEPKFGGSMQLSDTCPVSFREHYVPAHRCIEIPGDSALNCMAQYQRSWFHLLLGEAYLARIDALHLEYQLPPVAENLASLNELSFLRTYSLCLLNEATSPAAVDSLARVTAAMKLRISWLAQSTAAAVRAFDPASRPPSLDSSADSQPPTREF